jgi:hypothetical protein
MNDLISSGFFVVGQFCIEAIILYRDTAEHRNS